MLQGMPPSNELDRGPNEPLATAVPRATFAR